MIKSDGVKGKKKRRGIQVDDSMMRMAGGGIEGGSSEPPCGGAVLASVEARELGDGFVLIFDSACGSDQLAFHRLDAGWLLQRSHIKSGGEVDRAGWEWVGPCEARRWLWQAYRGVGGECCGSVLVGEVASALHLSRGCVEAVLL